MITGKGTMTKKLLLAQKIRSIRQRLCPTLLITYATEEKSERLDSSPALSLGKFEFGLRDPRGKIQFHHSLAL